MYRDRAFLSSIDANIWNVNNTPVLPIITLRSINKIFTIDDIWSTYKRESWRWEEKYHAVRNKHRRTLFLIIELSNWAITRRRPKSRSLRCQQCGELCTYTFANRRRIESCYWPLTTAIEECGVDSPRTRWSIQSIIELHGGSDAYKCVCPLISRAIWQAALSLTAMAASKRQTTCHSSL